MVETKIARGSATRARNKELRRSRILSCAGALIAENGFDGFTLSQLADRASVTVPTIHNLLGTKLDVCRVLVDDMVCRVDQLISEQESDDPIEYVETFIDGLMELYSQDESLYKAAFIIGERAKLFEHDMPDGVFHRALRLAEKVCADAIDHNYLLGKINIGQLSTQLFSCQRIARHDWMHGYSDLEGYRKQVLVGMYIVLAADATPQFQEVLNRRLRQLGTQH